MVIRSYVKCKLLISNYIRVIFFSSFFFVLEYFLCIFKWQKLFEMLASFLFLSLFFLYHSSLFAFFLWYAAIIANYMTDIWLHLCSTERVRETALEAHGMFSFFSGWIWNTTNAKREKILFNYVNGSMGMLQQFELRVAQLMGVNMRKYLRLALTPLHTHAYLPPPSSSTVR